MIKEVSKGQQIIPVVAACITNYTGKILLHRKTEGADEKGIPRNPELVGRYEFPGGMMEYGETPEQSLVREIKEELGNYPITILKALHIQTNIYKDGVHYLVLFYLCDTESIETPTNCLWIETHKIKTLNCLPGTLEVVDKLS